MAKPKTSKPKTVKKPKTLKPKGDAYTLTLKVNGQQYTATADTVEGALAGLPSVKAKTKGTLTVLKNGFPCKELILNIPSLNRLFFPGLTGEVNRTVMAKRLTFFING